MATKKNSRKSSAKKKKFLARVAAVVVTIILLLIIAAVVLYFFFPDTFAKLYDKARAAYLEYTKTLYYDSGDDDPEGSEGVTSQPVPEGDLADIATSQFSIHFLQLGNKYTGDSTLIKCGDTEVLIDAGSRKSSATTISSYINQYCTDGKLEYVIATHAHQDHIAGFVGNSNGSTKTGILYQYDIGTIIEFSGHNTTSQIYKDYVTATEYAEANGATVYTATQCWYEQDGASRSYALNEDGTLTLNVLYNYYYENETADENDYSVCVLLSYVPSQGEASHYLFTGDLEGDGESHLVDDNQLPKVKLFKGGHHGSKTSTTDKLLAVIQPENIAVCCCAGATEYTDNPDNTFPTQAFIDRVSKYTENVYVTTMCIDYEAGTFEPMNGDIVFYVDENQLKLWCSNNTTKLKDTEWFKANRTGWTD